MRRVNRPSRPLPVPFANELRFVQLFLAMFAADHGGQITLEDLLKALYVADCERMLLYWRSWRDWEKLEAVLAQACGMTEPRWFYWIHLYQQLTNDSKSNFTNRILPYDDTVSEIFATAASFVNKRKTAAKYISLKEILFAITRMPELRVVGKLLKTGLDRNHLKKRVLG